MTTAYQPFVSVVVATRNEERYIATCLRSLLQCRYPVDRWEIVVADGMSDDRTRAEIAGVARETPVRITVVDNPRRITPVAFNLAIGASEGEVVIIVGAHAEIGPEFVANAVEVLADTGGDVVGGPLTTRPGADTRMAQAIALSQTHPFGVGNSAFRTGAGAREVDTVPFGVFRAARFRELGLFDERQVRNQDYEFNSRLRRAGGRIFLDPRLQSTYFARPTLRSLLKQSWANGFWNALTHYMHPYALCARHALPALFFLGALTAAGLGVAAALMAIPTWLLAAAVALWACYGLYLLLDIGVAAQLARRHGWALWPALLLIFPAFHLTNGAGITWGWLRALTHRCPWRPDDGIPRWEERRADAVRDAA